MAKKPDIELFSRLKIRGPRFEEHLVYEDDDDTQPVDVTILPDIKTYRDLIVSIARALYLRRTRRSRVRKNFAAGFNLHLFKARHGSAVPHLVRTIARAMETLPGQMDLPVEKRDDFDEARDQLVKAVQFLNDHDRLPDDFPLEAIWPLASFGAGLRDEDAFELSPEGDEQRRARYTKILRQRVQQIAQRTERKLVDVLGEFVGAIFTPQRLLRVDTETYGLMKVPFASADEPLVARMVKERRFSEVHVLGWAFVSARRGVQSFDGRPELAIEPLVTPSLIDAIDKRLNELAELEDGWLDGVGKPLSKDGLEWLRGLLLEMMAHHELPSPLLAPMEDGGVSASWHFRPWYVSAEIDLARKSAYLHAAEVVTKEVYDQDVSLATDEEGPLEAFADFVRRFDGAKRAPA